MQNQFGMLHREFEMMMPCEPGMLQCGFRMMLRWFGMLHSEMLDCVFRMLHFEFRMLHCFFWDVAL